MRIPEDNELEFYEELLMGLLIIGMIMAAGALV